MTLSIHIKVINTPPTPYATIKNTIISEETPEARDKRIRLINYT